MISQPFTVDCFYKEPESDGVETSDLLDSFRQPWNESLIMNNTVFYIAAGANNDKSIFLDTNCEELAFPSLSDCNETRTHNHLVCKQTLKHLAKLTCFDKKFHDIQAITECRFTLNAYVT